MEKHTLQLEALPALASFCPYPTTNWRASLGILAYVYRQHKRGIPLVLEEVFQNESL